MEDKILFEQAYSSHGKSFKRIQQTVSKTICYAERSDWFFLGRDFAIWTVSVETVISCVFFVFESRQAQNKHGASAI